MCFFSVSFHIISCINKAQKYTFGYLNINILCLLSKDIIK